METQNLNPRPAKKCKVDGNSCTTHKDLTGQNREAGLGELEGLEGLEKHWAPKHIALAFVVLFGIALAVVIPTAPFTNLVGLGEYALGSACHGLFSFILLVVATVTLYLGFQLYTHRVRSIADLQLATSVMATLSLITILFGNWIYRGYRASDPSSPKSFFLKQMPEIHNIFFEFKEYVALFTLPLAVAAVFIVFRYPSEILKQKWLKMAVVILITLYFVYFAIAFGLGAAVTKLKSI